MPYLNAAEVETKLELAAMSYPQICTLITLPNPTHEARTCHAVRIRSGSRSPRHGVLFIGGVHAREWGSADILVSLVEQLLNAYTANAALAFGPWTMGAVEVRGIVESLDLFVFPDVNPDGRNYSQTVLAGWRKNRRPAADPGDMGVDVNRNYDFLWDYKLRYDPRMYDGMYTGPGTELHCSDVPFWDNYHGPSAFSEPETRNVQYLFDQYPHIRAFVDVHCYQERIYFAWGDDQSQSADPAQSFRNPGFDGRRGWPGDTYNEYIRSIDAARLQALGQEMRFALRSVRGRDYFVFPAYELYPVSGTSVCYAFSRHLADYRNGKVDSFLIEWGRTFQPDYDTEMTQIIPEVSAALASLWSSCQHLPLVELSPRPLAFGRIRLGTSRTRLVRVKNSGPRSVDFTGVRVEAGPAAARFSVPSFTATLAPGGLAQIAVTFTPAGVAPVDATLLVECKEQGQGFEDVFSVPLQGEGCSAPEGACTAPAFEPTTSFWGCLLAAILYSTLIVVLLPFFWIPSVLCLIKQYAYRIQHCREGNMDGCQRI